MNPEITIDTTRFNANIAALYDALLGAGQASDASTVVRDETRRLLKQCQRFSPPGSLAQGRAATKRDIVRAMTPLDPNQQFSKLRPRSRRRLDQLIKAGDHAGLEAFLRKLKGFEAWRVRPFDPALHRRVQDSRGRVNSYKKVFVIELAALRKYISQVQKNVGILRAGWLPSYESVGGQDAPEWVKRQSTRPGYVINELGVVERPVVTIANQAKGIGQTRNQFESALRARSEAIPRRIRLILSGYNKDIAAGMRPRRRAQETVTME